MSVHSRQFEWPPGGVQGGRDRLAASKEIPTSAGNWEDARSRRVLTARARKDQGWCLPSSEDSFDPLPIWGLPRERVLAGDDEAPARESELEEKEGDET
jgi:hypothetical protein